MFVLTVLVCVLLVLVVQFGLVVPVPLSVKKLALSVVVVLQIVVRGSVLGVFVKFSFDTAVDLLESFFYLLYKLDQILI